MSLAVSMMGFLDFVTSLVLIRLSSAFCPVPRVRSGLLHFDRSYRSFNSSLQQHKPCAHQQGVIPVHRLIAKELRHLDRLLRKHQVQLARLETFQDLPEQIDRCELFGGLAGLVEGEAGVSVGVVGEEAGSGGGGDGVGDAGEEDEVFGRKVVALEADDVDDRSVAAAVGSNVGSEG